MRSLGISRPRDLAQFVVPAPLAFDGALATPPAKEAYLQALADGLILVDAIKDIRTALHDQAKHALEQGDSVPASRSRPAALSGIGATRTPHTTR